MMVHEERFWGWVDKTPGHGPDGDCWFWTGRTSGGRLKYGLLRIARRPDVSVAAHRYSYELRYGPIEDPDARVMHSCDEPLCVNPKHLSLGTHHQNMLDMVAKRRHPAHSKTECKHGHPLSGENLYVAPSGYRCCRACRREAQRKYLTKA